MNWLTADLHLGHANICEYTGRPYSTVDAMNADLVRRWNARVQPEDSVWILGDLCMGKLDESLLCIDQLNGTKFLQPGNHDRMFGAKTEAKYQAACKRYLDAGISYILRPQEEIQLTPYLTVLACHFPYSGDSHEEDRFVDHRPANRGRLLVHGHCHGIYRRRGRMVDVGVDAWGGYPVAFAHVAGLFMTPDEDAEPLAWTVNE